MDTFNQNEMGREHALGIFAPRVAALIENEDFRSQCKNPQVREAVIKLNSDIFSGYEVLPGSGGSGGIMALEKTVSFRFLRSAHWNGSIAKLRYVESSVPQL